MHTIRLRGPWQLEAVARFIARADGGYDIVGNDLPAPARATMPADWSESFGPTFLGRVRFIRTFQKPTGLETGERVWLVVEPLRSRGTVRLADRSLGIVEGGGPAARFDITPHLAEHNRLEIVVEHPAVDDDGLAVQDSGDHAAGGLLGEVRLEIGPAGIAAA